MFCFCFSRLTWIIKKMANMGASTTRKMGFMIKMTAKAVRIWNANDENSLNDLGMLVSIVARSLLNRLSMRPMGVDSKKCKRVCMIELNMDECHKLDDLTTMRTNTNCDPSQNKSKERERKRERALINELENVRKNKKKKKGAYFRVNRANWKWANASWDSSSRRSWCQCSSWSIDWARSQPTRRTHSNTSWMPYSKLEEETNSTWNTPRLDYIPIYFSF